MSVSGSFSEVSRSVCGSAVCFKVNVIISKRHLVFFYLLSETKNLVLCLWGAEPCLHMYLLTLDPPPKYFFTKQKDSNLFG